MGPFEILVVAGIVFLIGAPLLVGVFAIGLWLRRTQRRGAFKTFVGAAIFGAVALLAFLATFLCIAAVSVNQQHASGPHLRHAQGVLLAIALGLLALVSALACALFSAWTIWRLLRTPAAPA